MKASRLLILLVALGAGGCSSMADKVIARVGGPPRGFLTPAMLTDAGDITTAPAAVAANGCTAAGCPQAPSFCTARGYQLGSDGYNRCVISVEQNLRSARR